MADTQPVDPAVAAAATDPQRSAELPVGTGIPAAAMARAARQAGGPAEVDVTALLQRIQALEAQARAAAPNGGEHPLVSTAKSARDELRQHYAINPAADGSAALRMADDLVDAAGNAVDSGDVSVVRQLGERFTRLLRRGHPGNGDHHHYRQATEFVRDHLPDAADTVTSPAPAPGALVVAGSVTG